MAGTREIVGRDVRSGRALRVVRTRGRIDLVDLLDTTTEGMPWLTTGLVDLQVNGFAGIDLNDGTLTSDGLGELCDRLGRAGTTTFLPTVITAEEDLVTHTLRTIAAARASNSRLREAIPGIHLEGPFISAHDGPRGVHHAEHIREPDLALVDRWQEAASGSISILTYSPHHSDAVPFVQALTERGIIVSIGHTHATPPQIQEAVAAGATMSTHLGNGAHTSLPRHPNYLWSQLAADALDACFIADGHHLPAETLLAMLRAKETARSILVSDSVCLAGAAPGVYSTSVGGGVELSPNGRLVSRESGLLAGAAVPLLHGVQTVARLPGFTLCDAATMATINPGRRLGQDRRLRAGSTYPLVLLDRRDDGTLSVAQSFL